MTDWGQLYKDHVDALAGLAGDLTDEQLATVVPASPEWDVQHVLQHLAGGASDGVNGRMDGAPKPEWTARHTSERDGRSVDELVEELRSHQDAVAQSVEGSPTPAAVWDIAVHHADIHEALGLGTLPDHLYQPIAEALAPRAPDDLADLPPYELFRGFFSRRSRSQMEGWGLDGGQIEEMCIFGPRDDDQPVPA